MRLRKVGSEVRTFLAERGFDLPSSLTANLGIVGESVEAFLARTLMYAGLGVLLPFVMLAPAAAVGLSQLRGPAVARRPRRAASVPLCRSAQLSRRRRRRGAATSATSSARSSTWSR